MSLLDMASLAYDTVYPFADIDFEDLYVGFWEIEDPCKRCFGIGMVPAREGCDGDEEAG